MKNNFCLCSVLQTIFKKYGLKISQEEIAKNLTTSENGFLADDPQIKKFMQINGFDYDFYWHNETPFNEPDMLLRDMDENNGILGINHHIYLLRDFQDPKIKMVEPENRRTIETDIYHVRREMENAGGFFGLIRYIH